MNTMSIAISAQTKSPELCVKWMDYQFGEEASLVANYGTREGESYTIEADGTYKWGTLITDNPDGLTQNQARTKYTTLNATYEDYSRVMTWFGVALLWRSGTARPERLPRAMPASPASPLRLSTAAGTR